MSIFSQYWNVIRSRSTVSVGVVAIFFFLAGIAYMRAFDWTMAVTNTE
jgi:nitrate/TMAO reductase-like tetraheme cytochrome c subunit